MTKKTLCPADGSDHAMVGVIRDAAMANLTGAPSLEIVLFTHRKKI